MVLLKTVDAARLRLLHQPPSRKGVELAAHPACSLLFPWHPLERQIRIEGTRDGRVRHDEADAYFATRPRGVAARRLGIAAVVRSSRTASALDAPYAKVSDRFDGVDDVPRPPHWSGFLVRPHTMEFWQGRPGRMHDRVLFERLDETALGDVATGALIPAVPSCDGVR